MAKITSKKFFAKKSKNETKINKNKQNQMYSDTHRR